MLAIHTSDLDDAERLITTAAELGRARQDQGAQRAAGLIDGDPPTCFTGDETGREAMLAILGNADEHFDEVYSSGWSNLTYLDVEQRRLRRPRRCSSFSLPMTIERICPICRALQLGSRGRMHMLRGRVARGCRATPTDVLAGPSAPLARTWPFLVRGLIELRRCGDADDDIDEAWELASRFGELIRLLLAAAALVEQAWLTGQSPTIARRLPPTARRAVQGRAGVDPR